MLQSLRLSKNLWFSNNGELSEGVSPLTKKSGFRGRVPRKPLLSRAGAVSAVRTKALGVKRKLSKRDFGLKRVDFIDTLRDCSKMLQSLFVEFCCKERGNGQFVVYCASGVFAIGTR